MKIKHAATLGAALLAAGAVAAPAAAAPPADRADKRAATVGDPRLFNFYGKSERRSFGMSCSDVPLQGGGTTWMGMYVTSDSSERTASVQYVQTFYGGPPLFWGTGKIMVLKATHDTIAFGPGPEDYEWISGTAERPGPPDARRATCSYSWMGEGTAELVHLQPLKAPSAQEMAEWCASWSPESAEIYRPADMCQD